MRVCERKCAEETFGTGTRKNGVKPMTALECDWETTMPFLVVCEKLPSNAMRTSGAPDRWNF